MRASARTGQAMATVDRARTRRPSDEGRPGEARVLQLQRTAGNRAVLTLVQRKGCGCGGACGTPGCGPGSDEESAVQRAIGADLHVKGKYSSAAKFPSYIFFDFNSAEIDGVERKKITDWVAEKGAPAAVTAKASEEGGANANDPMARARGNAVAAAVGGAPKPKVLVDTESARDHPDYREMRRVELAHASNDRCNTDPEAEERTQKGLAVAADTAREAAAAARTPTDAVRRELDYVFHASGDDTASEVAINFAYISMVLDRFAMPGQHVIGTPCTEKLCSIARAVYDPDNNRMITCPDLWKASSKTAPETLLHEAVHAAFESPDHSYLHEPMFPFLTTKASLQNPDSYVEFTRAVLQGRRTNPRPATGVFEGSFSDEQQLAVSKAVAWAIKDLGNAERELLTVYAELVKARNEPDNPVHLQNIEGERKILAKHFGATPPPKKPKPDDKWITIGAQDRLRKLLIDSGSQPKVVQGAAPGATLDRRTNTLAIGPNFSDLAVPAQARAVEWAMIVADHDIPAKRREGYFRLIEFESHDYSATEG